LECSSLPLQALAREYREVGHSGLVATECIPLSLYHLRKISSVLQLDILFLEDFGTTPYQLFKSFCPKPVAAASLAQVFKAVTHDDRKVAVKVTGNWQ